MTNIDTQINDIVEAARSCNGQIELIVKGDLNDADYAYTINQYTPDEFISYGIDEVYKFYKAMADDFKEAERRWFEEHDYFLLDEINEAHNQTLERICDKNKIADRYKDIWVEGLEEGFIPSGDCCEIQAHSIDDVKLKVILKEI
jgi:hypothetical protein